MLDIVHKIIQDNYFIIIFVLVILYIAYVFHNNFFSIKRNFSNDPPKLCIIMNAYIEDMLYDQLDNFDK